MDTSRETYALNKLRDAISVVYRYNPNSRVYFLAMAHHAEWIIARWTSDYDFQVQRFSSSKSADFIRSLPEKWSWAYLRTIDGALQPEVERITSLLEVLEGCISKLVVEDAWFTVEGGALTHHEDLGFVMVHDGTVPTASPCNESEARRRLTSWLWQSPDPWPLYPPIPMQAAATCLIEAIQPILCSLEGGRNILTVTGEQAILHCAGRFFHLKLVAGHIDPATFQNPLSAITTRHEVVDMLDLDRLRSTPYWKLVSTPYGVLGDISTLLACIPASRSALTQVLFAPAGDWEPTTTPPSAK